MATKFVLALDASQIHEYLTCPLKWYYRYKCNLELNELTTKKAAPDKGTLIHSLLDKYYNFRQNGYSVPEACANAIDLFISQKETEALFPKDALTHELERFLTQRFHMYCCRYETNDFDVVTDGIELGFSKKLYEDEDVLFIVEGRIDLMVRLLNGYEKVLAFCDHKTQDRKSELYPYKIQFKTYAWATGAEYGLINYFGMQKEYEEGKTFRRNLIYFPPKMIQEWHSRLFDVFWEIYRLIYVKPESDEYAELKAYQIRNEASCSGAFDSNPCQFTHLCEEYNWDMKERIKEFKYSKKEAWSPWTIKQ